MPLDIILLLILSTFQTTTLSLAIHDLKLFECTEFAEVFLRFLLDIYDHIGLSVQSLLVLWVK